VKVLVSGGAGVLGSSLVHMLLEKGFKVKVVDIQRVEEAWRLRDVLDKIEYVWKSSWDLDAEDLEDSNIILDCGLLFADRPFSINSPTHTFIDNMMPPLRLLEAARKLKEKPIICYASSFNSLYGYPKGTVFHERLLPYPNNPYGLTKASAELTYLCYAKCFKIPVVILRVSSAYGEGGRSDELPHRLIIYGLRGRRFRLRSPHAKRLWTYSKDIMRFYERLIEKIGEAAEFELPILHSAGNKGDVITSNVQLAEMIRRFIPSLEYETAEYEPGEEQVDFKVDSRFTRNFLNWSPSYSLEEGLKNTVEWFKRNIERYV
jgi:nucleoside-diphosphate-sugar epimerase